MKLPFIYRAVRSHLLYVYTLRCVYFLVASALLLATHSSVAFARISGEASLTYANYRGTADVRNSDESIAHNSMSSNSFLQNYSLLYSSSGAIYNSRVGRYDVMLGYNWSALDTTFKSKEPPKDSNYNETRGHILYKGEILLDPKEVPFKLNAYSRDITINSVTRTIGNGMQNFPSIFGTIDQPTGINDGMHLETGATLVAGVKNGMTNGYNEILRHFPMILVDYKDSINRDLRTINMVDNRLSRLAFVSLNKKENWFHYRHTRFDDYINNNNNYIENEVQLGTVDQYMTRRWIDFSNWIKVSTDIQFSKHQSNYMANPIEETNLNLFLTTERESLNARTFNTFNRYKNENNKLSYQITLPLYASGIYSNNTSWNTRTSYRDNLDIDANGVRTTFINTMVGYRIDTFKRAPFSLSQSFDSESTKTNLADYLTFSGLLETTSTPLFSRTLSLGASYNIKKTTTSSDASSSSDFLEQTLIMHAGYAPTNKLRIDLRQSNTFTDGKNNQFYATTRDANTQIPQYTAPSDLSGNDSGTNSYRSLSTFSVSYNPKPRLFTTLILSEDVFKSDVIDTKPVTNVTATISYSNDRLTLSDNLTFTNNSRDMLNETNKEFSNHASLRYIYNRNLDASGSAYYRSLYTKNGTTDSVIYEQRLNYNSFSSSGMSRKLFEISESILYSDDVTDTNVAANKSLTIGFRYYPIRNLTLAASAGYSFVDKISDYTLVWNASTAVNFRLLQASLDYSHGIRKIDNAVEDRFIGNIRRSF